MAIMAELKGLDVKLVPASVTGRVPVLEITVADALGLTALYTDLRLATNA